MTTNLGNKRKRKDEKLLSDEEISVKPEEEKRKRGRPKKVIPEEEKRKRGRPEKVIGMSEYERRREENLRDNAKFMASLGINQAKEMLNATVPKRNNQRISTKRVYTATRRSARIRCIQPQPVPEIVVEPKVKNVRKPLGTVKMSDLLEYENGEQNIQRHSAFASELKRIAVKSTSLKIKAPLSTSLQSFLKDFSKVKVTENQVRKIVGARIFSVVMHPTKDKVLVGGGGQNGSIGLWDVKQGLAESGAVLYFPHSQPVNCLLFNPYNLDQLFSCSYDGTLRCGYFEKGVSEGIYYTPVDDDVLLRNFAFQNADIMLVSQSDGNVAVIDVRTKSAKPEHLFHASKKALRTVDVHPTKEDYVITAGADCMVSLWDLRTIKKKPKNICSLSAGRIINSAYFSPITGKYILSTSQDNTLRIHDSSELSSKISCLQSISHNTYTGRWVTKFRATWHPLREDLFACGGNAQPRRIELFSDEGHRVMALQHVALINSIQALNIFHPTINAVVGANASGKLHVFM